MTVCRAIKVWGRGDSTERGQVEDLVSLDTLMVQEQNQIKMPALQLRQRWKSNQKSESVSHRFGCLVGKGRGRAVHD